MFNVPQEMVFQGRISAPGVTEYLLPGRLVKILEQKKGLPKVNFPPSIDPVI